MKKHQAFKETLGTFFLDILQRFVFAKDTAEGGIDREVLESLLSFVVTKELPKDDERGVRTKRISPFAGHCIDSTPVVRSFILQLLLRDDPAARAEYLGRFLEGERRFMRDAQQGRRGSDRSVKLSQFGCWTDLDFLRTYLPYDMI